MFRESIISGYHINFLAMQKSDLVFRVLGRPRVIDEISGVHLEDFFRIMCIMDQNSYTGHLKICSTSTESETWMIFRKGTLIEFFTIKKGFKDIDFVEISEKYPRDEPNIFKNTIEITVLGPDKKLNEKVEYFLDKLSLRAKRLTVPKFMDDLEHKIIRKDFFAKHKIKVLNKKVINRPIESSDYASQN